MRSRRRKDGIGTGSAANNRPGGLRSELVFAAQGTTRAVDAHDIRQPIIICIDDLHHEGTTSIDFDDVTTSISIAILPDYDGKRAPIEVYDLSQRGAGTCLADRTQFPRLYP